jgi:hypothetical protein
MRHAAARYRAKQAVLRQQLRSHDAYQAGRITIEQSLLAHPLPDLTFCPLCLVPFAESTDASVRLTGCVHAICSVCAAQVLTKTPAAFDCVVCERWSFYASATTRPVHVAIEAAKHHPATAVVPCDLHASAPATGYCHTYHALCCADCLHSHAAIHRTATSDNIAAARARLQAALAIAVAACDELVARAADAATAAQSMERAHARATMLATTASIQRRLRTQRTLLMAGLYEEHAELQVAPSALWDSLFLRLSVGPMTESALLRTSTSTARE